MAGMGVCNANVIDGDDDDDNNGDDSDKDGKGDGDDDASTGSDEDYDDDDGSDVQDDKKQLEEDRSMKTTKRIIMACLASDQLFKTSVEPTIPSPQKVF